MIHKRIFLMTLIIALIASLGAISATDLSENDTTTITADTTPTTINDNTETTTTQQENTKTINKNMESNTKQATTTTTVNNYEELYKNLTSNTADEDTTIILGGEEETYTITNTITLSEAIKNLVIEGKGKTIDGTNTKQFLVSNHICNISLNNLTITKCNNSLETNGNTSGGAIYTNNTDLTLNNVNFINNTVYICPDMPVSEEYFEEYRRNFSYWSYARGGALSVNNGKITVNNSIFENNTSQFNLKENYKDEETGEYYTYLADSEAGALYSNNTNLEIINSKFINNDAETYGGAILIENGKSIINNTYFTSNKALIGNAIYYNSTSESKLEITNSTFEKHDHTKEILTMNFDTWTLENRILHDGHGGALFLNTNGTVIINNTRFINNTAKEGGAINYHGSSASNLKIDRTEFKENNGIYNNSDFISGNGGSLYVNTQGNVSITNTNFTENIAESSGSAIEYYGTTTSNLDIDNSIFDKNGYDESQNLATIGISNYGNTIITNSQFTENFARKGAIDYQTGAVAFSDIITKIMLEIEDSHLKGSELDVFIDNLLEEMNVTLEDVIFGTPIRGDNKLILDNLTFKDNQATVGAGAINIAYSTNTTLTNSVLTNNTGLYGATHIISEGNVLIENITYDSNKALSTGNLDATSGAITLVTTGNTTINNINFTNNFGEDAGAIDYMGYNESNLLITNSNFNRNGMDTYTYDGSYTGGAIAIVTLGNVTLDNNNYTSNFAHNGGAIYYINPSYELMEENISPNSKLIINNSKFNLHGFNPRTGACYYGGALSIESNNTVLIDNSEFVDNMGLELGGAVYYVGHEESSLTVNNTLFDSNGHLLSEYTQNGGAIYANTSGNTTITNTEFINNHANYYSWNDEDIGKGGALYYNNQNSNTTLTLTNLTFDSNGKSKHMYYNTHDAGAAYINTTGNVSIRDSKFINNSAWESGAVHIIQEDNNSSILIENTVFDSNGKEFIEEGTENGGAINAYTQGNISIVNSSFMNNVAQSGGAIFLEYDNLEIIDSTFDNNGIQNVMEEGMAGAAYLSAGGNTRITNSNFTNNKAMMGGAIYSDGSDSSNLTIADSLFDNNRGNEGGALHIYGGNASITNTNFTNNLLNTESMDEELWGEGIVICSSGANLTLNHTNFMGNGVPSNLTSDDIGEEMEIEGGLISFYGSGIAALSIDYTNFTGNTGSGIEGGIICYYNKGYNYYEDDGNWYTESYDNGTFTLNHTVFKDNTILASGEGEEVECEGYILYIYGNANIDNTQFIYNKLDLSLYNVEFLETEDITGPIYYRNWDDNKNFSCNITNCVFIENTPANFIVNNSQVILDYSYYEIYQGEEYFDLMFDGYIPTNATVMVYVDESSEATEYQLKYENTTDSYGNTKIVKVYVDGLNITSDHYVYKLVITQTHGSQYYDQQDFTNNTYYFIVPHDYAISVNATSPIKVGDNTTIKGKVNFTNNEGEETVFADKPVDLYINGTYIDTVLTDSNGEYEFNYTGEVIGTHDVQVTFNQTIYLPRLSNNTNFTVEIRESVLNITASPTKIGKNTSITFNLSDKDGNPISHANITFYIDNQEVNITTGDDGVYVYECEIGKSGDNYVLAFYDGDYAHTSAVNSTIFSIDKLNTTVTVSATNTTLGKQTTVTGKLVDEEGKPIQNAPLIIYIDDDTINKITNTNGEFTFNYTSKIAGENYVAVFYEGNDTYIDTTNKTSFHVEKHNTTITVTAQNTILGEKITINGKLVDEKGNIVPGAQVIVFIDEEEVDLKTDNKGEFTYNYTTKHDGLNYVEVFYEGNDTHKDSFNHTIFNVTKKAEAQIDIDVLNDTVGNVEVEVTVTDEKGEPIPSQTVEVTLPNGTKTNMTTDKDGKITVKDQTAPVGKANITVKVPDTDNVTGTNKTQQITIDPDYQKIIDDMNKTINKLNETVQELEDTIDKLNKTSVITAIPEESTVDDAKVTVTLNNKMGTPISNATLTVKNSKGETIGNATTDSKGIAVIPVNTKAGTEKITVSYLGNANYSPAETTVTMKTSKNNVTVTVDPVNGVVGEKIVLTAHVLDTKGNPVSGGNLVFKLNGKTLRTDGRFDSNATAWKFQVKDGIVSVTINADLYLRNAKNLTASYSGSYKFEAGKSKVVTAEIKKRNAQITVTCSPTSQKQYNKITFTAKLKDTTPKHGNNTMMHTGTKVLFKINGKTLKDDKGKQILVKVNSKNVASYKYTVPAGMGGITKDGNIRDYTVEAVLVSDTYYPDTRDNATFNVQRSPVTININKVSVNSANKLSVKATIKDYKGKNVIGDNNVAIKINGKSYVNPNTNKTQYFKVTNGKIDLSNLQLAKGTVVKKVMIVTGARQAYLGCRNETSNIVKV